jgi:hypothetical protein
MVKRLEIEGRAEEFCRMQKPQHSEEKEKKKKKKKDVPCGCARVDVIDR